MKEKVSAFVSFEGGVSEGKSFKGEKSCTITVVSAEESPLASNEVLTYSGWRRDKDPKYLHQPGKESGEGSSGQLACSPMRERESGTSFLKRGCQEDMYREDVYDMWMFVLSYLVALPGIPFIASILLTGSMTFAVGVVFALIPVIVVFIVLVGILNMVNHEPWHDIGLRTQRYYQYRRWYQWWRWFGRTNV